MSTDVTRMVPRRAPPTTPSSFGTQDSEQIRAEIARLDADREAAETALATLEAGRNAVLLTDDDAAAERHDAEMARQRRSIERCVLRRPGLETALSEALSREEAARTAEQVAEAEAEVAAVLADIAAEYMHPAERIAAFLARYRAANAKARAAGIDCIDTRIRFKAGYREPDREVERVVYLDERGNETGNPYPPGEYAREDEAGNRFDRTGRMIPQRRMRTKMVTEPGLVIPPQDAGALASLVNLPGAHLGERSFHYGNVLDDLPDEVRRRLR